MDIKKEPEEVFFDLSIVKEEYQLQEPPENEGVFKTIPEEPKLAVEIIDAKVEEFEREWKRDKRKETKRKFSIKCFICDKIIANRGSFRLHMKVHKNNISKNPDFWKTQRDHLSKSQPNTEILETSKEPGNETDAKIEEFERAWKADKRKLKYKTKCRICNKQLLSEGVLRRHIRAHNAEEFRCPKCSKVYKKRINLKNHIDSHDKVDSKKYVFLRQFLDLELDKRFKRKKYFELDYEDVTATE